MTKKRKIILAISGATGFQYGAKALEILRQHNIETHLVISKSSTLVRRYETEYDASELSNLADYVYPHNDVGAAIASGSFKTEGMLVAPCSVKTMSEIAYGMTDNLIARSADVTLKERRKLVLLFRETPLHLGHIKSMMAITEMGGIVMPPVPAFYARPKSIDEMLTHTISRALDLFGIETDMVRWEGHPI